MSAKPKFRVVLTDRALNDLRIVRDYIARNNPDNAASFLEKILDKIDLLEISPDSFSNAPEDEWVDYTLRQLIIKPYRILYRIAGKTVEVMHIRHGAQDHVSREEIEKW